MELIRIPTAAERLGVTRQYIYKLIKDGEIRVVEIDGMQFIDWDTLTFERQRAPKKNEKKPKN